MTSENEKPDGHSSTSNLEKSDAEEQNDLPKDIERGVDRDNQNESGSEETRDPNLVEWDPNDPENPLNWPSFKRTGHVVLASVAALFANITSTAFAPAAAQVVEEFNITDSTVTALTVSIYLLGFAVGPLIIAPLSEHYGRLPIYIISMITSVGFLVGCSQATSLGVFLACRFITGVAGSGPNTVGGGTIADVTPPETRGRAMGGFAVGPLLGPVIGPMTAGFIAQYVGWRWVFRVLYIAVNNPGTLFSQVHGN
ncbi:Major facilitator superfamily [Lasiodiplodia theobromae]|uniref:Efflux pump rdc3 n=1 Tax=Lasiodiplodia theobromae TaxID=45133 RepID=A0A5N5DDK8_9PEZI|nr:Efflux pump rdc3 [Lasiodiplodia theobromae]KAF9631757.1 Major facilitator superfamily [Lasiodiplodia theobromae]